MAIEQYRENFVKEGIKRSLYCSNFLRIFYDELANYRYRRDFEKHSEEVKKLHNIHKGERCFIVATGPSLNTTNLDLIRSETILAVNTAFQTLNKHNIISNYYIISDRIIWDVYCKVLLSLDTKLFLGYVASRHYFRDRWNNVKNAMKYNLYMLRPFVLKGRKGLGFSKDISKYICVDTTTVVYLALQIAYYLGFKEVYLLGCDCDYSGGHAGGLGFVNTSKLQHSEKEQLYWNAVFDGYRICKREFEKDGRAIYNSTVDGKLELFERVKLEEAIK